METSDVIGAVFLCLLLLACLVLMGVAAYAGIEGSRVAAACAAMGYESSSSYVFRGEAYCHRMVDGTSITVQLHTARRDE